mmetsp:Transcript_13829/g.38066  ORF Transcript_13829/g.38066 Transcript_13829/m.38066 type:complete len:81 (+) Transcript_13829:93-335(+)|eukprot:CAMPEP_0171176908 /NCGR_PEP_ID=MMETSP0790-20130122/11972_1 /TAXON_ID=2925 /ORGANISM="Alexandrium catenella, Strain OF101" /LENGTH=80 /DNA_ID=CAMNT_0011641801 /DNA_START=88 /DNA_END=330 /DNA_ORIENTATION=+
MSGMDDVEKKTALATRGAKNLAEAVNGLRSSKAASLSVDVKRAYKLMAAGRYEEPVASVEAIVKREFPDGAFPKPFGSAM